MLRQVLVRVILLGVILASGTVVYAQLQERGYFTTPCKNPIEYSVGNFDIEFDITRPDFLLAINEASLIWENALNRNLFEFQSDGELKIHLIYDERQAATDKLQDLDFKIENTQVSYNSLKAQYAAKVAQYDQLKASFEADVKYWNERGGAPKGEYEKLQARQQQLNQMVAEINAMVNALNNLARQLNLNVSTYNKVGNDRGGEFEEGVYIDDREGERIEIYEFADRQQLVRLLAHELGHALGLEHVEDANAVMYRLNSASNDKLTAADIAELKRVCKIQ